MRALPLLAVVLLAVAACSTDEKGNGAPPREPLPEGDAPVLPEYPPGPYGTEDNDVFPNFAFEGFVNAGASGPTKNGPFGSFDVKSLAESKSRYAFIHVSGIGSELSALAADQLAEKGQELVEMGAEVVEVLANDDGTAATRGDLEAWLDVHALRVTAAVDSPESPLTVLGAAGAPESGFIVQMPAMRIYWVAQGSEDLGTTVEEGIHWLTLLLK